MKTIVIANKKGGVGKTTTTQNLAACLAQNGQRVLAVDMDAQTNLTRSWGVSVQGAEKSVLNVLRRDSSWQDIAVPVEKGTGRGCVLLAPASRELAALPELFAQEFGKELLLKEALAELNGMIDLVLIDSPPALDLLAVNTYAAADRMIIPVQCEFYSLEGLALMRDDLERVRKRLNPRLEVLAIVPTFVDKRKRLCRDVLELLARDFNQELSSVLIRDNVSLAEAPSNGKSIFAYDSKSYGARDYDALGKEILNRINAWEV